MGILLLRRLPATLCSLADASEHCGQVGAVPSKQIGRAALAHLAPHFGPTYARGLETGLGGPLRQLRGEAGPACPFPRPRDLRGAAGVARPTCRAVLAAVARRAKAEAGSAATAKAEAVGLWAKPAL